MLNCAAVVSDACFLVLDVVIRPAGGVTWDGCYSRSESLYFVLFVLAVLASQIYLHYRIHTGDCTYTFLYCCSGI